MMKTYLQKLFATAAMLAGIVAGITAVTYALCRNRTSGFEYPPEKHMLVVGDSQTAYAVDDRILNQAINVSRTGAHIYFSYLKVKCLLDTNPQIDSVIVPISPLSITREIDRKWFSGISLQTHLKPLAYFMPISDLRPFICNADFQIGLIQAPLYIFCSAVKCSIQKSRWPQMGGYLAQNKRIMPDDVANREWIKAELDTTSVQYIYLRKIASYCRQKHVKLILVNTPKYKADSFFDRHGFDSLRKRFIPDLEYVDLSDFPLQEDCYADIIHINGAGARKFSEYLVKYGFRSLPKASDSLQAFGDDF